MTFLKPLPSLAVGITLMACTAEPVLSAAFDASPTYENFSSYNTVITENGDEADIYYPTLADGTPVSDLPTALFLQGALVDKSFYSDYASQVAQYGFTVVVPNHFRFVPPFGNTLLPEVSQIDAVLTQMNVENSDASSPLAGRIDTDTLGLIGHSLGGSVGLSAISDSCIPLICEGTFQRPTELKSGAFFGANLRDPNTDEPLPIDNDGIGVVLLQGDSDGRALPINAEKTFDNIASPPKALVTLTGVNHFGITNSNFVPGAVPDLSPQTLDQDTSIETVARWSGLFLRGTLLNDDDALDYVLNRGALLDPNVSRVESVAVDEPSGNIGLLLVSVLGVLGYTRCRQGIRHAIHQQP